MRVPTDPPPPFSAKVRCVKSIRLDLFLLYTSLFQHPAPPLFSKSPVCKVNTGRPFSFVTKRTFWQHACGHFGTWVGGGGGGGGAGPQYTNSCNITPSQWSLEVDYICLLCVLTFIVHAYIYTNLYTLFLVISGYWQIYYTCLIMFFI